ncbi:MAG: glycosyltransferase family 2 protein [Egibacteraceae bacterium]
MPSLSIIVVCFGGDARALLDELGRQRGPGDEVLLVDNARDRGGTPWIRAHPQADVVIDPGGNVGYGAAVNLAASRASGEALLVLNPDALPLPGCLARLRHGPDGWGAWMGVVTLPGGRLVNAAGGESHFLGFSWVARYGEPVSALPAAPYPTAFLSGACMVITQRAWRTVGGYAEDYFLYHEDVDLSHRLRLAGVRFGVVPDALVSHEYEFLKGDLKWRMLERNRWRTVLRTYPTPLLACVAPLLIAAELGLVVYAASHGWLGAKLRSWWDLLTWLPRAPRERHAVQSTAAVSAAQFAAALGYRLDSPFLGQVARRRLLDTALAAYWRAVLLALNGRPRPAGRQP